MIFAALKETLRTGTWVNPPRVRLWACLLLVGFVAAGVYLFATAHGLVDYAHRPLGTDFSCLYAAGRLGVDAYNFGRENTQLVVLFGSDAPLYGWFYPPFLLPVAQGLAKMPYVPALGVWIGSTFVLYLGALWWLRRSYPVPKTWWLAAAAFPAVFLNFVNGQNGFLTAALLTGGLAALKKRPIVAGILFGALAYKPQLALVLPIALIAGGLRKPLVAAICTVAVMVLVSTVVYGFDVWPPFFAATRMGRQMVLEQGAPGYEKIQSLFAFVRHVGGPLEAAYAAQAAFSLWVMVTLVRLWRGEADFATKAIGLVLASLLATPYAMDYDLVLLAPAILLSAARSCGQQCEDYERTCVALLWLSPLFVVLMARAIYFPVGWVMATTVYFLILRKTRQG